MSPRKPMSAFSLVELLVILAIVGVLISMLLPAVNKARDMAGRARCTSNLRQIGIALHSFHQDFKIFPAEQVDGHSGFTFLLPYVEHDALYRRYDQAMPGASAANQEVISTRIDVFTCPAEQDPSIDDVDGVGARQSNYLMSAQNHSFQVRHVPNPIYWTNNLAHGAFTDGRGRRQIEIKDGLSHSIAIGETRQRNAFVAGPHWGVAGGAAGKVYDGGGTVFDANGELVTHEPSGLLLDQRMPINRIAGELPWDAGQYHTGSTLTSADPRYRSLLRHQFGSAHRAGAHFLFADGLVRFVRNDVDWLVFVGMYTVDGQAEIPARTTPPVHDGFSPTFEFPVAID